MFKLGNFLRRVHVLVIHHTKGEALYLEMIHARWQKGHPCLLRVLPAIPDSHSWKRERDIPLLVVIKGDDIIHREIDSQEDIERITDHPDFLWEKHPLPNGNQEIVFTRAQFYRPVLEKIAKTGVPIISIHLWNGEASSPNRFIAENSITRFYTEELHWRLLFQQTSRAKNISLLITRKLLLPGLVGLLGLLVLNFFLNQQVTSAMAEVQSKLSGVQKDISAEEKLSQESQLIIQRFEQIERISVASIADQIASLVPGDMLLETFFIFSPLDKITPGKPLQVDQHTILIQGICQKADAVPRFMNELSRLSFSREVTLTSIEQEKRSRFFKFNLKMTL